MEINESSSGEIDVTAQDDNNITINALPMSDKAEDGEELIPKADKSPKLKSKKRGKKSKKKKTTAQLLISLLIKLGVILAVVWLALTFVISINIHYGNNMHPAINDGDFVVSFRMQRPYINSAVIYNHDGKKSVGRVIAMGGNDVYVTDEGIITVNGVIPSEEVFYPTFPAENSDISYPYHVDEGKVFILNDFRSDMNDSRSFGAVDLKDVEGPLLLTLRRRGF